MTTTTVTILVKSKPSFDSNARVQQDPEDFQYTRTLTTYATGRKTFDKVVEAVEAAEVFG